MSNKEDVAVDTSSGATPEGSLFQRKIEFHLARKPLSCLPNTSDFKLETLNPSTTYDSSQPIPSSSSKNPERSDFLDNGPDFIFRMSFRRIGAGLENLGNTCFLNSVLQCLTYTEPLVGYLQYGNHQNTCRIAGFCALCAIQKHVSRALQSSGRIVSPKDLVSNLRCISRNFRNARQEDAHEYMIHLLESMHKCCLPSRVPAESPGAYEKSLIHKIFGGRLRSQVKCLQCSHCSNTFDPFLDLSLEIVKADSLNKALAHFTAAEQLDGGERQYKCERCKQKVKALKQLTISKAPYVLTIHLKRFRSHFSGQKIDKKVHFGSTLDLKPFVSGAYEGDLMYTLYGVLVHAGWSTHSGHYYCFVRTSSGLWYSLDDNRVAQVSERTVLEQKAYMLFYVRHRPKKAMDVHKENLITTMRNASSSCTIASFKGFQNGCTPRNSSEIIPSGVFVKHFENSNASEVLVQQNTPEFVSSNNVVLKKDENQNVNGTKPLESSVLKSNKAPCASLDDNGAPSDLVSAAKPSILECPSGIATNGGNITSHVISSVADTKVHDAQPNCENVVKLEQISLPESGAELSSKIGISSEETPVPMPDIHSKSSKSRSKLRKHGIKSRLKISKSRVVGSHLSTKMLYGASLSLKKRKKCKKIKQSKKNVLQEPMLTEDPVCIDTAPATSDRMLEVIEISKLTQESGSTSLEANDTGFCDSRHSQQQNGVTSVVTRSLEETAVPHWEGIESNPAILESNNRGALSIGYVPDEWDEEYDRGKRKKVRVSRNNFGGPNVFQEVATKKAKLKANTQHKSTAL